MNDIGSILLPTNSTPEENRKMGIDIASKMSQLVAKEGITKAVSGDFIFKVNDNIKILNITTGSTERTVRWPTGKQCIGQEREVCKYDNGSGEVKHILENTSDKFFYPGNSSGVTSMWTGLYLQRTVFRGRSDGWEYVRGVIQPVALEPDIGGGRHVHRETILNGTDPSDTNWHAIDLASTNIVPVGATWGWGEIYTASTVVDDEFSVGDGTNTYGTVRLNVASKYLREPFQCPISSSRTMSYKASSANVGASYIYLWGYIIL